MRNFKYLSITGIMVVFTSTVLTGCTYHEDQYLRESQTVKPISTTNTKVRKGKSFYPVPNIPAQTSTEAPSLVPPDSNLQRFEKKPKSAASSNKQQFARIESSGKGGQSLVLAEKSSLAWKDVGKALHDTSYQILDQDPSIGSYYILDAKSTGNKITKTTPIYRVLLKSDGGNTHVVLLNDKNQPASADVSKRILKALQKKLA